MEGIYLSYVWRNKPIIVKGGLDRIRDITFVEDVVNILCQTINNKKLRKNETINLSSGKFFTVKKLINEIVIASKKKNIKIIKATSTPGDSKVLHTDNKKLHKLFPKINFTPIQFGLKKYFTWINKMPVKKKY